MNWFRFTRRLSGLAFLLFLVLNARSGTAASPKGPLPRWRDNSGMVFVRGGQLLYRGREIRVRSFYMDECEVTNRQYCLFLNDGNGKHWNANQIERKDDRLARRSRSRRLPCC